MDKLVIEGKHFLEGELPVSGSKNTALTLMAASILADGATDLSNIPDLRDINTFSRVIEVSGASVNFDPVTHQMVIDASSIDHPEAPYELVKRMRASFYMLGALLGRCGKARVSLPGGCAWGPRPVDLHLSGLKAFGASIDLEQGYVLAHAPGGRLAGGRFHLHPSSVGATINLLLGAVTARGASKIEGAAIEPDVVVFCRALETMGAQLEGIGTSTLEIEGVRTLSATSLMNCPDRIEMGTFMIAAGLAGRPGVPVRITGADTTHLGESFLTAFAETGILIQEGNQYVDVVAPHSLNPVSIQTGVFPGFPTDLQAQWTVLLTQAEGNAKVVDTIYFDRFKHIPELRRMGVNAIVVGNEVVIEGKIPLQGAKVMSTDLRASVSLVLAGMVAEGTTEVQRIYHLDRGYEMLETKLARAGISIWRERYDEFADPIISQVPDA